MLSLPWIQHLKTLKQNNIKYHMMIHSAVNKLHVYVHVDMKAQVTSFWNARMSFPAEVPKFPF